MDLTEIEGMIKELVDEIQDIINGKKNYIEELVSELEEKLEEEKVGIEIRELQRQIDRLDDVGIQLNEADPKTLFPNEAFGEEEENYNKK